MKRIGLGLIFAALFSFKAMAESAYSYFEWTWSYKDYLTAIEINAHNKHSSKKIYFDLVKIWFSDCSSKSGEPDRIYRVGRTIMPYSDKKMFVDASLGKGKRCAQPVVRFIEPKKYKPIKKKKKSWSQKTLDKIKGN